MNSVETFLAMLKAESEAIVKKFVTMYNSTLQSNASETGQSFLNAHLEEFDRQMLAVNTNTLAKSITEGFGTQDHNTGFQLILGAQNINDDCREQFIRQLSPQ